jgi:hypothetical protein
MKLRGVLALLFGTGLAALGCESNTLHGGGGGQGGSAGHLGANGGTGGGVDGGSGGIDGGGCLSDLFVDWQIQNPAGGAVTCDAIHATEVVVNIDGLNHAQVCPSGHSSGSQDIVLQENDATYEVTVNLLDMNGNALAVPQTTTINVVGCASYETPGPAILVASPPTQ